MKPIHPTLFIAALCCVLGLCENSRAEEEKKPAIESADVAPSKKWPPRRLGVNMAGPEFGGAVPGKIHKDYTFNNEASFKYFCEKGLTLFRVPIKWDRLQHELKGDLDKEYLGWLKKNIAWAKKHGGDVLIDLHNYGGRKVKLADSYKGAKIDNEYDGKVLLTTADFVDVWLRLSKEFKDEPAVWGYGLMNEPHGMGTADWKAITNAAVKALREAEDKKLVLVGGLHWSNAWRWEKHNGPTTWIDDPADNFMYEAHCYFDKDNSGSYKKSYEEELKGNAKLAEVGMKRVKDFTTWCEKNKVRGFVGEFGCPYDDPRWYNETLEQFMVELDRAGMGGTYWAAGIYWGKYALSIHPPKGTTNDRPQMGVLLKHLPPGQTPKPANADEPEAAPMAAEPAE